MSGYSIRVAEAIKNADGNLPGVQLGRKCLDRDISVTTVARTLGVTRQTVYNWFSGKVKPQPHYVRGIETFLAAFEHSD
jgi:hypothetical protein